MTPQAWNFYGPETATFLAPVAPLATRRLEGLIMGIMAIATMEPQERLIVFSVIAMATTKPSCGGTPVEGAPTMKEFSFVKEPLTL